MEYRVLGRTGVRVGEIGMGTEHLLDKDEKTVVETIKSAVDGGVNYFDCHPGHDHKHEDARYEGFAKLGKAIERAGGREGLCLTYLAGASFAPADTLPHFDSFLAAMKLKYIDVFILQFCDKAVEFEAITASGGLLDCARALQRQGRVKYIGISTHSAAIALKAVGNGAFDMLMYPVNPAFDVVVDEERYKTDNLETLWDAAHDFDAGGKAAAQPRKDVYAECRRAGVGLVAMKPFAGGFIFGVEEAAGFTPVNLVAYALAQNGVSTVAPGCTCPEEIKQILGYYDSPPEARDFSKAVAGSRWSVMGNCLYCNHCMPCSVDINIAETNRLLDAYENAGADADAYSDAGSGANACGGSGGPGDLGVIAGADRDVITGAGADLIAGAGIDAIVARYKAMPVGASACVGCGVCEDRCPFRVNVIDRMKKAAAAFGL